MLRRLTVGIVLGCLYPFLLGAGEAPPLKEKQTAPVARPPRSDLLGDPLPPQARVRFGSLRLRLRERPGSVTFSPDGKVLVTAQAERGRVQFWDVRTGRLIRELPPGTGTTVAFSPDGKQFLTGHPYGQMHLWNARTGEKIRTLFVRAGHSMAFSRDGKSVLTTLWVNEAPKRQSALVLFDLASGKEIRRFEGMETQHEVHLTLAYSPDGMLIAAGNFSGGAGGEAKVIVWDAATGQERSRFRELYNVNQLAFSADSKSLIVGGAERVRVVEVATGKVLREFPKEARRGVALDRAGKLLLTAGDRSVWDLASGKLLRHLPNDLLGIGWEAALSPDGNYAAVSFTGPPFLALWDVAAGKQIRFGQGHLFPVEGVAAANNGRRFATAGGQEVCLWDADGKLLRALPYKAPYYLRADTLHFTPDGATLSAGGSRWDVATGERIKLKKVDGSVFENTYLLSQGFCSADGALLGLRSTQETSVTVWDALQGKRLHTVVVPDRKTMVVTNAAFSPAGKVLAVACFRNRGDDPARRPDTLLLCDARSGARRLELRRKRESIYRLLFFPDGEQLAASTGNGVLEIWHLPTGSLRQELTVPLEPRQDGLQAFAVASHGQLLATQAKDAILLWETTSGQRVHTLGGFYTPVKSLAFAGGGRFVVSGHEDGTALLWDLLAGDTAVDPSRRKDEDLWRELAGKPSPAYRVLWALVSQRQRALSLLKKRLAPAPAVDEAAVKQWIVDLGDTRFARRDHASKQLRKVGLVSVPALRQALKGAPNLETRRRLEGVLAVVDTKVPPADVLRGLRGVQLLELLGTAEAQAFLGELAGGQRGHPVTRAAQAARARMEKR